MSKLTDCLRVMRARWRARRQQRSTTRGDRELRRAEARALHHAHSTFDEGRRDPGAGGGGI
jgi:hypothetical protein